jgi:hypothetical protein
MDVAAAADRHFDSLMDAADARSQAIEDRADEIYNDLWDQCKADPKVACQLVDSYCDDPYDVMAQILIHAAGMSRRGVMSNETRASLGAFVMAKLTGILSDAADDKAKDEA